MTFTALLICALATWQIVEIYRHGSLFSKLRVKADKRAERAPRGPWVILTCPFCLGPWVALVVVGAWSTGYWLQWLVTAFAVLRLAQLGNDVFHQWNRSPPREEEEIELPAEKELGPDPAFNDRDYPCGDFLSAADHWLDGPPPVAADGSLCLVIFKQSIAEEYYDQPVVVTRWSSKLKTTVNISRFSYEDVLRWRPLGDPSELPPPLPETKL